MPSPLKQPCKSNFQSGEQPFLPLAVLFEAWSRTTGTPTVFYIGSFAALLLGLINKDIAVDVAGFPCQSRYWAVGMGVARAQLWTQWWSVCGKFSAATMILSGKPWDTFHIFKPMTHCAAIDKLKTKFNAAHGWTDSVLSFVGGSKQGQQKTPWKSSK